jgi:hypothetical protein
LAEIDLVEIVGSEDEGRLVEFGVKVSGMGLGLIAATADAARAQLSGGRSALGIHFQPQLPLAGVY